MLFRSAVFKVSFFLCELVLLDFHLTVETHLFGALDAVSRQTSRLEIRAVEADADARLL